jgi:hypothetical protein
MSLVVVSGGYNQVDRGADNPTSYIPTMEPVREAKARSRAMYVNHLNKVYWIVLKYSEQLLINQTRKISTTGASIQAWFKQQYTNINLKYVSIIIAFG